jgi:hypothetical protein
VKQLPRDYLREIDDNILELQALRNGLHALLRRKVDRLHETDVCPIIQIPFSGVTSTKITHFLENVQRRSATRLSPFDFAGLYSVSNTFQKNPATERDPHRGDIFASCTFRDARIGLPILGTGAG